MLILRRAIFPRCRCSLRTVGFRHNSSFSTTQRVTHATDSLGIPLKPTWSVNDLLSSYPKPTISSATLSRLHNLSALIPPEEGTKEHEKLKSELEELIRLVEAVKLVNTDGVVYEHWGPELGDGAELTSEDVKEEGTEMSGRELLEYATKTEGGLYVVEADRRR
ncbi:hypothetical protein AAF712_016243 [Marasmius tenuissimus]|uniref:Uncharacterized protein n=1 Tax=Marasmius tenuissimus TaxID=585030 RepID=A0ABR2Z664_9AGAR|nr:hypothetical protein PM082_005074 [Marasmius tenuissimus]